MIFFVIYIAMILPVFFGIAIYDGKTNLEMNPVISFMVALMWPLMLQMVGLVVAYRRIAKASRKPSSQSQP